MTFLHRWLHKKREEKNSNLNFEHFICIYTWSRARAITGGCSLNITTTVVVATNWAQEPQRTRWTNEIKWLQAITHLPMTDACPVAAARYKRNGTNKKNQYTGSFIDITTWKCWARLAGWMCCVTGWRSNYANDCTLQISPETYAQDHRGWTEKTASIPRYIAPSWHVIQNEVYHEPNISNMCFPWSP